MSAPVFSQDGLTIRVQYQSRRRYEKTDSLCVRGYEIPRPHGGNGEKGVKSKLTKKYKNEKPSFLSFLSMTVCQKKNRQACNNASGDFLRKKTDSIFSPIFHGKPP